MSADQIGMLSGALVVVSAIPYIVRVYQGKIETQITSWVLWTLIGFALLVTYKSSGAEANVWPAVFGFTNPFIVMLLTIKRLGRNSWTKPDRIEVWFGDFRHYQTHSGQLHLANLDGHRSACNCFSDDTFPVAHSCPLERVDIIRPHLP